MHFHYADQGLPPVLDREGDAAAASRLVSLRSLSAGHCTFTNDHLYVLSHAPNITGIDLQGSSIDDQGIPHVRRWQKLNFARLKETDITDAATVHLGKITTLDELQIQDTGVTGEGLANLTGLKSLQSLITDGVDRDALASLSCALPEAEFLDEGRACFVNGEQPSRRGSQIVDPPR